MKKLLFAVVLGLSLLGTNTSAQLRTDKAREEAEQRAGNTLGAMSAESFGEPDESFFGTLFNKNNWSMNQIYSFSYSSNGANSIGLSMFTNRFNFKASDNIRFSADVSAVYSPFASFGNNALNSEIQKQINGVYLTNARMDWKLGENTFMTVQYSGGPDTRAQDPFYSPFDRYGDPFSSPQNAPTLFTGEAGFGTGGWRSTRATVTR